MTNANGQNVRHHLMSGILGDHQEFLIPISALAAGSGFAFQLELFLNDDAKVVGSTNTSAASYSLEEVSYDMELVEVSDAIRRISTASSRPGPRFPFRTSLGGPSTPLFPVRVPSTRWISPNRPSTPRRFTPSSHPNPGPRSSPWMLLSTLAPTTTRTGSPAGARRSRLPARSHRLLITSPNTTGGTARSTIPRLPLN
jgi:hypothetical protein